MERQLKTLVVILTVLFSVTGVCQEQAEQPPKSVLEETLMKKEWKIDKILGFDEEIENYKLTLHDRTKQVKFAGSLVQFLDKGVFTSEYTAWCGNDNFTWLNGDYQFLGNDKVAIHVKDIRYYGEWNKPEEHRQMNWMVFAVKREGDTIIFVKQKDDLFMRIKQDQSDK